MIRIIENLLIMLLMLYYPIVIYNLYVMYFYLARSIHYFVLCSLGISTLALLCIHYHISLSYLLCRLTALRILNNLLSFRIYHMGNTFSSLLNILSLSLMSLCQCMLFFYSPYYLHIILHILLTCLGRVGSYARSQ
jgi:hypothetical protein